jgi:hypothetical protein
MRSARGARMGAREAAGADAAVPGDDGHDHERRDLQGQQEWIGEEAGVPGVHVGEPGWRDQERLELGDDAEGEQTGAGPEEDGGGAGADHD